MRNLFVACLVSAFCYSTLVAEDKPWLEIPAGQGPGAGKHIVFISGDEEYRSEEALPQLAKILAKHHGFRCTVLFAIDPKDGTINPNVRDNIPGTQTLADADLMVIFTRYRDLPDEQMKPIADYIQSGKPVVGMRTATHAFKFITATEEEAMKKLAPFVGYYGKIEIYPKNDRTYRNFGSHSKDWEGGFGKHILGETWVNHHGEHGKQGTRGLLVSDQKNHPILRGIADGDIFGTTDVYTVNLPLRSSCQPLVMGEVTETLESTSAGVKGKLNNPMMPVAWTNSYTSDSGKTGRVFTTTMGASQDLASEGTRRMLVNGCYWAVGLEDKIPAKSEVTIVGEFKPSPFKFDGHVKGKKPADYGK